jgi:hypothetical protein
MNISEYILPVICGGLAGSIFTFTTQKLINKHAIALHVQIFPCLQNNKRCLFKFTLLESCNVVEWVELFVQIRNETPSEIWPSRMGLGCNLVKTESDKLTYRIENLRRGDFVNILFVPPDNAVFDNLSASDLVDYNSSDNASDE